MPDDNTQNLTQLSCIALLMCMTGRSQVIICLRNGTMRCKIPILLLLLLPDFLLACPCAYCNIADGPWTPKH